MKEGRVNPLKVFDPFKEILNEKQQHAGLELGISHLLIKPITVNFRGGPSG